MPMLIVQGVHDEVIAVDDVDALVRRYEAAGADIGYLRDRLSAHLPLEFLAIPVMVDWLADRFAGRPTTPGTRTVWSVAGTRRALAGHRRLAALSVRLLTGRRIRGAPPRDIGESVDAVAVRSRRASIAESGRSRA